MQGDEVSPEVRRFILKTINSVEQLEVLLFLMSNSSRAWSAEAVAERTRLAPESVAARLTDLHARDLLTAEAGEPVLFQYAPASSALAEEVASSLEGAYRERKDTIIQLIFSRPLDNIRVFADAFRIKKEED